MKADMVGGMPADPPPPPPWHESGSAFKGQPTDLAPGDAYYERRPLRTAALTLPPLVLGALWASAGPAQGSAEAASHVLYSLLLAWVMGWIVGRTRDREARRTAFIAMLWIMSLVAYAATR